jgi:hypothetical protein
MTQQNLMLQFFDELRVLIGRSFAGGFPGRLFGQVFASETALKESGQFWGPQNQGTLLGENRFIKYYDAIKVEEGLRN